MSIFWGFVNIIIGTTWIYFGAFMVVTGLLPHDQAMQTAEWSGHAIRKCLVEIVKGDEK